MKKYITFAVPCYNSADYMKKCIDSLLVAGDRAQIVIVNDGSHDDTGAIADAYEKEYPHIVQAVHKENGGHGSGVNVGLAVADSYYFKVVDSDDWLDEESLNTLMRTLDRFINTDTLPDVIISDYVRVKDGTEQKKNMRFRNAFKEHIMLGWEDVGWIGRYQDLMMHALLYRTDLLKSTGLQLPEHTFYVDCLYAFKPLFHVKSLYYISIPLYQYRLGRAGQSVSKSAMFRNMDQLLEVIRIMCETYIAHDGALLPRQDKVLKDKIASLMCVASVHLKFMGTKEASDRNRRLFINLKKKDRQLYRHARYHFAGIFASGSDPVSDACAKMIFNFIDMVYKVN
jgi:glycosyltransferase involved in cell wall biosynthesis